MALTHRTKLDSTEIGTIACTEDGRGDTTMKGTNSGTAGRNDWRTPEDLLSMLNDYFGPFLLDVAADENNVIPMASLFIDAENDGLAQSWTAPYGTVTWCNPPWGEAAKWVEKAILEREEHGARVVRFARWSNEQ